MSAVHELNTSAPSQVLITGGSVGGGGGGSIEVNGVSGMYEISTAQPPMCQQPQQQPPSLSTAAPPPPTSLPMEYYASYIVPTAYSDPSAATAVYVAPQPTMYPYQPMTAYYYPYPTVEIIPAALNNNNLSVSLPQQQQPAPISDPSSPYYSHSIGANTLPLSLPSQQSPYNNHPQHHQQQQQQQHGSTTPITYLSQENIALSNITNNNQQSGYCQPYSTPASTQNCCSYETSSLPRSTAADRGGGGALLSQQQQYDYRQNSSVDCYQNQQHNRCFKSNTLPRSLNNPNLAQCAPPFRGRGRGRGVKRFPI